MCQSGVILETGHRDLHAESDEEQRDEEVADAHRFRHDVEVVREGREADPGDERTHLARQANRLRDAGQEEAPREGAHQHQLGRLGHGTEKVRKDVLRDVQRPDDQQRSLQ